jgi:quercetin dioxygenase-like cupin family protein
MEFSEDIDLTEHSHEGQWGIVLEGRIDLTIGEVKQNFVKGDRYFIPEGVSHFGKNYAGYADMSYFDQKSRYKAKEF